MWRKLASIILKYRIVITVLLVVSTAIMGYYGRKVEITYQWAKLLPDNDPTSLDYEYFKEHFGQDGTVLVIGVDLSSLKKLDNFNAWFDLGDDVKKYKV